MPLFASAYTLQAVTDALGAEGSQGGRGQGHSGAHDGPGNVAQASTSCHLWINYASTLLLLQAVSDVLAKTEVSKEVKEAEDKVAADHGHLVQLHADGAGASVASSSVAVCPLIPVDLRCGIE